MSDSPSRHCRFVLAVSLLSTLLAAALPRAAADAPTLDIRVDITDLPRHLIHAKISMPAQPGQLAVWYPRWIPGIHAPRGPVENIGGFQVFTPDEKPLTWRRDDEQLYRFLIEVPEGVDRIVVKLDYIANQASVNSTGVDVHGGPLLGAINWNACLVYPEGHAVDEITAQLRIHLPEGWKYGTWLQQAQREGDWIHFQPVSLRTLVDSPLICGEHFRTIDLEAQQLPASYLHLTSESKSAIQLDDDVIQKFRRLVAEAGVMFGRAPYDRYHFLVTCSDQVGPLGLEHLRSSLNGVEERGLIDPKLRRGWTANLLPHEYVHAWCGKYRRPQGMATADFHTPKQTKLLWIYEGLTTYLGEVLAARCGLHTHDEQLEHLASMISRLNNRKGRRWRNLEDTAIASHHLRGRSPNWGQLRRSQDYYQEGMLYWMEADALIRQRSGGQKSLDDFCQEFLAEESDREILPYEEADVYAALGEIIDYDWADFFERRVLRVQEELPLDVVGRLGYRLEYTPEPSEYLRMVEDRFNFISEADSVGMVVRPDGTISDIVPDSAADRAGLGPGMEIVGVGDRKFSKNRLRDAIADSVSTRKVELLVAQGERLRTIAVDYTAGPRFLALVRNPDEPDILRDILSAKAAENE